MSTSYYLPGSKTMFGKKKIGDIRDIRQKLNVYYKYLIYFI